MKCFLVVVVLVSYWIGASFQGVLSAACIKEGSIWYDRLAQRCVCHKGKSRCCRVRRDFTSMSLGERYRYIKTLVNASTQLPYRKTYNKLVGHHTAQFRKIHNKEQFLPWHRLYLLNMENLLRRVDPRVTVPYWDWSLYSSEPWAKKYHNVWSSAPWGLGGNGGRGSCVYDGPFRTTRWSMSPSAGRKCLKRNFNGSPPDIVAVHKILRYPAHRFTEFEVGLRDTLHNNMHCRIGGRTGTMCSKYSANAPEFLLHHSFTDKLWADWQKKSPRRKTAYFAGKHKLLGANPRRWSRDLMDLSKQPGGICVEYDDPTHDGYKEIHRSLSELSHDELSKLPRHKFSLVGKLEFSVFMVNSKREQSLVKKTQNAMKPRHVLNSKAKLNSRDRKLGFKVKSLEAAAGSKREISS